MAKQSREEIGKQEKVSVYHDGVEYTDVKPIDAPDFGVPADDSVVSETQYRFVARTDKPKGVGNLTVKLDLDASDAITGLKAIQREAKKATQAIRELETYYERDDKQYYVKWRQQGKDCTDIREVCMTDIPTVYLHRELMKRQPDLRELRSEFTGDFD